MSDIDAIGFDEDLVARSIQGLGLPEAVPTPLVPPLKNLGLSTHSSIDVVAPKYAPTLHSPKQNIMLRVIEAHRETEDLTERKTKNFELDSVTALAEIDRLSLEREEAFRKELDAAKSRDSWSTLSVVAQYVTSVGSVALGVAVGGIPGILLGAGGLAGGAVRLLHDTHLMGPTVEWLTKSKELQTSIQQHIDTAANCLQMGLGIAGGITAWRAGAFAAIQAAHTLDYLTNTSSILSTAGAVMNGGSRLGAAYYNKRIADVNATTRKIELGLFEQRQELTYRTKEIGEVLETDESLVEQIRKAIQRQEVELS